jgi:hypothetical protein
MVTDQVRIASLYAGLYRTIFLLGLLIAAAWLFTLFSYYLSEKTGADWFTRSGSVMGLIGAAVTFRQVNFYQSALARALNEGLVSVPREIELGLKPPIAYRVLSYLGYVTGIVGTGIWGYGDLLLALVS